MINWVVLMIVSGFPPLLGFFLKVGILFYGVVCFPSLYIVMIVMSAVRFLFYIRLMVIYFMRGDVDGGLIENSRFWLACIVSVARLVGFGVI